jgi:hypothetical protein
VICSPRDSISGSYWFCRLDLSWLLLCYTLLFSLVYRLESMSSYFEEADFPGVGYRPQHLMVFVCIDIGMRGVAISISSSNF